MKFFRVMLSGVVVAGAFFAGVAAQRFGIITGRHTEYLKLSEPLLLTAEGEQKYSHMLPAGTAMYADYSFPEGHTRYIVYVNVKGPFAAQKIVSNKWKLIDPIWGTVINKDDLNKVSVETPVSKDDLVNILRARRITKEELAGILKDWKE